MHFIVSREVVFRIVARLLDVGRLTRPTLDEESGIWTATVATASGRHTSHGVDPIQCLANLHKKALPGIPLWR